MTKIIATALFALLLSSCISDNNLKPVIPVEFIHDNNSKVWISTDDIARNEQEAYTFFIDGSVYIQKRSLLGQMAGKKGKYNVHYLEDDNITTLRLEINDVLKEFNVEKLNKNEILLKSKTKKEPTVLRLIPLDKPF